MKNSLQKDISKIHYVFFGFILMALIRLYYGNLLLHQLENPVLNFPSADNTYWFLLYLKIPQFLVSNIWIAPAFDLLLFSSTLLCLIFKRFRIFPILFSILFFIYFITINNFQAHHSHYLVGILFLSFLFCFKPKTFASLFYFMRYYFLFTMVSAALWKILRGSVFQLEHMSNTLIKQHLYLLSDASSSTYTHFIKYLIDHPFFSQSIFIAGTLIELIFIIGFFTKKYDKLLIILFTCFFIGNYTINQLPFFEFYIFLIILIPWNGLNEFYDNESLKIIE